MTVTLEEITPSELKPFPGNPKLHTKEQIEHIAESIKKFGFTQNVVADESGTILIGHARTEAAKLIGLEKIPVLRITGLKEHEKKALCALDNQLAQATPMDALKLESLFKKLRDEDWPLKEFGWEFSGSELEGAAEGLEPISLSETGTIKQMVILFEGDEFNEMMRKFQSMRVKNPVLNDNTEVFLALLRNYEDGYFQY